MINVRSKVAFLSSAFPEGYAGTTPFTIECTDWKDEGPREQRGDDEDINEPLTYKFIQTIMSQNGETIISVLRDSSKSFITIENMAFCHLSFLFVEKTHVQ